MKRKTWLDKEIGYTFTTEERAITEKDLDRYNTLVGGTESIFVDDDAARALQYDYKGRIVPGVFLITMLAGMDLTVGLAADVPLVGMNDIKFLAPAYSGDRLRLVGELAGKRTTSKGHTLVNWKWTLKNQEDAIIATGVNSELFPRSETA
ncbi:MAG: MaoC family dehydratase [Chloroflexi bacterium]|nr:MaoC family dehydratase [Chloroflexota bacterium]